MHQADISASTRTYRTHRYLFLLVTDMQSEYASNNSNLFGALLFLSYIITALICVALLTFQIRRDLLESRCDWNERKRIILKLLPMTVISFAVLSFNMLSFLIYSYSTFYAGLRAQKSFIHNLWEWMSHRGLFDDFARTLLHSRSEWTLVSAALLQSMGIILWLAKRCRCSRAVASLDSLTSLRQSAFGKHLYRGVWSYCPRFCQPHSH